MSTQYDAVVQHDFAVMRARMLALSYGKHSCSLTFMPDDDYEPRHELTVINTMGDAADKLVFYNQARGGFQRARGAEMIT